MSKNLKLGQIVNVFEDGKSGRATKATVVKIEKGRIHLNCSNYWAKNYKVRIFKQVRKSVFYNIETNNLLYKNNYRKSYIGSLREVAEVPYYKYLLDTTTTLEFDDWYEEKVYD